MVISWGSDSCGDPMVGESRESPIFQMVGEMVMKRGGGPYFHGRKMKNGVNPWGGLFHSEFLLEF